MHESLLDPPTKPKAKRGGLRPGAGRPPTAGPVFLIRLTPHIAADLQSGVATLFVHTPVARSLRTLDPVMVQVFPPDLARAIHASKAKVRATPLQQAAQ